MSTASEIKAFALSLGFCKVGVTGVQRYERVLSEASARQGYDRWLKRFQKGLELYLCMSYACPQSAGGYAHSRAGDAKTSRIRTQTARDTSVISSAISASASSKYDKGIVGTNLAETPAHTVAIFVDRSLCPSL